MDRVEESAAAYSPLPKRILFEDYLDMIADGTRRLEYHDGQIVDIKSATDAHGTICTNLTIFLGTCVLEKGCKIYAGDREVWIPKCRKMYYPDHVIVCGTHRKKQMFKNVEATINPSVVIEVLSDSTEKYDLTMKARCFKTIEELTQIVYVRQDRPYVFTLTRFENKNLWLEEEYFEEEDVVDINGCKVTIAQIYRGVVLPNEAESSSDV